MKNEYIPYPVIIENVSKENVNTKTFRVRFKDKKIKSSFNYKPGQFAEISLFGAGEVPISITSSPTNKEFLEFTIRAAGKVTNRLFELKAGDMFYVRGPYGNFFPISRMRNKPIYIITGGIGLPPLRGMINFLLSQNITQEINIFYGVKQYGDFCFKKELENWSRRAQINLFLTVEKLSRNWQGNIGLVTNLLDHIEYAPKNGLACICGPTPMVNSVVNKLLPLGFKPDNIYISKERHMKCGIGKCGHCNIAEKFVCVDGPIFTYRQLQILE